MEHVISSVPQNSTEREVTYPHFAEEMARPQGHVVW